MARLYKVTVKLVGGTKFDLEVSKSADTIKDFVRSRLTLGVYTEQKGGMVFYPPSQIESIAVRQV